MDSLYNDANAYRGNKTNNLDGGYSKQYTIEEIVDLVNAELTMDCALPQILPMRTIRRIIETEAAPWFYQNYRYAVHKNYYFIHRAALETEEYTRYKWLMLPEEIQTVVWLFEVNDRSLYQLGINAPNLSINMGVTNQPYLSSYVTTIGELGTYKAILDSFSDMINQLSKFTLKYEYNQMANRLHILTQASNHIVAEVYANIEPQHLYADPNFIQYVQSMAKIKLGELVGRYDFNLPGEVKYNSDGLISEGKEKLTEIKEKILGMPNSDFLFMTKR